MTSRFVTGTFAPINEPAKAGIVSVIPLKTGRHPRIAQRKAAAKQRLPPKQRFTYINR